MFSAYARGLEERRWRGWLLAHCRIRFQVRAYWKRKLLRKCANKKLPMVDDLREESDHENLTRLVIVPRSNRVDMDQVMNHPLLPPIWKRAIALTLYYDRSDGRPAVKNLLKSSPNGWCSAAIPCAAD